MNIIHVFHNYYPIVGGMEKVVQGLAEAQAQLGHNVAVITSNYGFDGRPTVECYNNVSIHRLTSLRLKYSDLTIPLKIPNQLLRKAELVHVHGHYSLFSQKLLTRSRALGVKTACYFMAVDAFRDHPNFFVKSFGPYYAKRNINSALKNADIVCVKSFRDLKTLKDAYNVDASYLPDALNDSILALNRSISSEFKEKFGIKQQQFFLFIGRLHKLKGPQILVKALTYLDKDVAAVFIGPNNGYRGQILRLAEELGVKDRVYVLDYVDEKIKIAAIDACLAVVNPSIADHVEVFSIAISEAWAREKPVIASRIGELSYRIKEHENGLLVEPSNPEKLGAAMIELFENAKLAEKMGKNGKSAVFPWVTIAKKSVDLYLSSLTDTKR